MPGSLKKKNIYIPQNTPPRARAAVPDMCKRACTSMARARAWAYTAQYFPFPEPCLSLALVGRAGPALHQDSVNQEG